MVSISGMPVSLKMDLRFPITGQQGHGRRNIQLGYAVSPHKNIQIVDNETLGQRTKGQLYHRHCSHRSLKGSLYAGSIWAKKSSCM